MKRFDEEVSDRIAAQGENRRLAHAASGFLMASAATQYSYNFSWLGRPIIQYPQDILAMQELVWRVQPDLIIETGIAHGGSLIFYASLLELNAACGGSPFAKVLGIDTDIRFYNRKAIEAHPLYRRITMLQGSSTDPVVVEQVRTMASCRTTVMVCLDSNHTHDHVLAELNAYAPLVSVGSYCVVFDTLIEGMPEKMFPNRPWGPGNNPMTAVREYLRDHPEFESDRTVDHKLMISVAPYGYLRRTQE